VDNSSQARTLVGGMDATTGWSSVRQLPAEFLQGDAQRLPFESESVDAVRSERTLQWLPDPNTALSELVRVARSGSHLVVIDTDWDSLIVDLPDLGTSRPSEPRCGRLAAPGSRSVGNC
jgi:ubiquinone/menaquinone biosynthesis C-methylase UbiE